MPGGSINDIKSRIKSVEGTMQITKAMELVATSKLRHAKLRAERVKPYLATLEDAVSTVGCPESLSGKDLVIVIAGDRGLAGGYNNNIFKLEAAKRTDNSVYLPVGKKANDYIKRRALPIIDYSLPVASDVGVGDSLKCAEAIWEMIKAGEIASVTVVYTKFVNMLTQAPKHERIFPAESSDGDKTEPILDEEPEVILESVLPQYIGGYIYGSVCEAVASECAARRTAMNSANKNAEEMIESLTLSFNRARQAVITQEITEIVSGAEAL